MPSLVNCPRQKYHLGTCTWPYTAAENCRRVEAKGEQEDTQIKAALKIRALINISDKA
jgi:hypothetical protein